MSTKKYLLIVSSIFLLAVIIRSICFVGLIGSDDLSYNRNAYNLARGAFTPQPDLHYARLGLALPVALLFKLFGVNELSSTAFPFICFIVTFWLLVSTGTLYFSKFTGIIAGLLYAFLPIEIFNATMLLPDLTSATCISVSGFCIYQMTVNHAQTMPMVSHTVTISGLKTRLYGFLGGLMLGWAYWIRETALFFGVFVVGYLGYTIWTRRTIQRSFWFWFGLGTLVVVGMECGYYYWTTGNPLFRYLSVKTSVDTATSVLPITRYFYGVSLLRYLSFDRFRVLFHISDFSFYYFFVFAGIIYAIQKRTEGLGYFIGWLFTIFLLFSFASKSLSQYHPIRSVPRYFVTLTFPAIIIMAWYLTKMGEFLMTDKKQERRVFRVSLIVPFLLVFVINLLWFSLVRTLFLFFVLLLLLISYSERLRGRWGMLFPPKYAAIVLSLILLYMNIMPGIYAAAKGERPRKGITCERTIRPLLEFPLSHKIYTDTRTEAILEYFYQYQYDNQILPFSDVDINTLGQAYMVANWGRLLFLKRVYNESIPEFLYHPFPQWLPYARIEGNGQPCLIYKIP